MKHENEAQPVTEHNPTGELENRLSEITNQIVELQRDAKGIEQEILITKLDFPRLTVFCETLISQVYGKYQPTPKEMKLIIRHVSRTLSERARPERKANNQNIWRTLRDFESWASAEDVNRAFYDHRTTTPEQEMQIITCLMSLANKGHIERKSDAHSVYFRIRSFRK